MWVHIVCIQHIPLHRHMCGTNKAASFRHHHCCCGSLGESPATASSWLTQLTGTIYRAPNTIECTRVMCEMCEYVCVCVCCVPKSTLHHFVALGWRYICSVNQHNMFALSASSNTHSSSAFGGGFPPYPNRCCWRVSVAQRFASILCEHLQNAAGASNFSVRVSLFHAKYGRHIQCAVKVMGHKQLGRTWLFDIQH